MRLINIDTFRLEEHAVPPPYTVLSHRWGDDEISLQEFHDPAAQQKKGFAKIRAFIGIVAEQRPKVISHVWIDTCCIDKSSSAELSEAINSMYRWYQQAKGGCIVYLPDVDFEQSMGRSVWFTRGWTLQELIAPTNVRFYNKFWQPLGTKLIMKARIESITGISTAVLDGSKPVMDCSVAQRMSWAASRETTRIEDKAYSLMGLFDVNMPMLYGEGEKAFIRLQEEIIKQSDDHSIFGWGHSEVTKPSPKNKYLGILASSTDAFANCRDIVTQRPVTTIEQYAMTNVGLSIKLKLFPYSMSVYLAVLNCGVSEPIPMHICIFLRRLEESGQYARVMIDGLDKTMLKDSDLRAYDGNIPIQHRPGMRIFIRQRVAIPYKPPDYNGFRIIRLTDLQSRTISRSSIRTHLRGTMGANVALSPLTISSLSKNDLMLPLPNGKCGTVAVLEIRDLLPESRVIVIKLGFDFDFSAIVVVTLETLDFKTVRDGLCPSLLDAKFGMHNDWIRDICDGSYQDIDHKTLALVQSGITRFSAPEYRLARLSVHRDLQHKKGVYIVDIRIDVNALQQTILDQTKNKRAQVMSKEILLSVPELGAESIAASSMPHTPKSELTMDSSD